MQGPPPYHNQQLPPGQAPGAWPSPGQVPYHGGPPPPKRSGDISTEAIVALVFGIMTPLTSCFPLGIVALWMGAKARKQAAAAGEPGGSNAGMALAGMICGGVFGVLWGLYWLFYAVMMILGFGFVGLAALAGP